MLLLSHYLVHKQDTTLVQMEELNKIQCYDLDTSLLTSIIVAIFDFVEQVNIRIRNMFYSLSLQCCTTNNPKIRRFYLSASFRSRYCHTILIMKHDVPFLSSHSSSSPPDLLQVGVQNGFLVLIHR